MMSNDDDGDDDDDDDDEQISQGNACVTRFCFFQSAVYDSEEMQLPVIQDNFDLCAWL